MDGFIDKEMIQAQYERIREALLPIGMSVHQQSAQITEDGDIMVVTVALLRETAYEQLTNDIAMNEAFSSQMAGDTEDRLKKTAQQIEDAVKDPETLERLLRGEQLQTCDTNHGRVHEGLCLDCGKEIPRDEQEEDS